MGSGPGYRYPVVVISANAFNDSRIGTVIVVVVTSNLRLAAAPGNVEAAPRDTGLARTSVVNVSQVLTLDKGRLAERVGALSGPRLADVERGLRLAMGL